MFVINNKSSFTKMSSGQFKSFTGDENEVIFGKWNTISTFEIFFKHGKDNIIIVGLTLYEKRQVS